MAPSTKGDVREATCFVFKGPCPADGRGEALRQQALPARATHLQITPASSPSGGKGQTPLRDNLRQTAEVSLARGARHWRRGEGLHPVSGQF